MAFSYGFYNSIQGDRKYDSVQISHMFDGLITDGVYEHIGERFFVRPSENGLAVIVGTGRAWFLHTWNLNDSDLLLQLDDADLLLDRIDSVILDVNTNEESRTNELKILTGTPSAEPNAPTLIWENNHRQYVIANILVPAEAAEIGQESITYFVGQEPLPFVMGVLEKHDITQMVAQWEAEWNTWFERMDNDAVIWEQEHRLAFETWIYLNQEDFIDWFDEMKDQLSEDAAGNLQNQITDITEEEFNRYYSLTNRVTQIIKNNLGKTEQIIEIETISDTEEVKATTTFSFDVNDNRLIITQVRSGTYLYTKTTKIGSNSSGGKDITESYTKTIVGDAS